MEKFVRMLETPLILLSQRTGRGIKPVKAPELPDRALGKILDRDEPFNLSPKDLSKHCYILGSTGCGKTTMILNLIEKDIRRAHSVVILDMRGDLVNGALGLCERLNVSPDRVTLLDLREKEKIQGFNPLSGAGEPFIRALHLLDVLANEAESWGVQLEETLRSALLLLAHASQSITDLEHVFYDASFRDQCTVCCSDESVVRFWERYGEMSPEKQNGWALPVLNKVTSLMAVPSLRAVLSTNTKPKLGERLNQKGHIYLVSLAVDELHRSARMMGSLLVSAISREMMARVNVPEHSRNPVRLYVDEFENMASESFESLIAEGRRFKLSLVLSHQTLSQLEKKLRSVIRNNVGIQVIFQCGFEDAVHIGKELPDGFDDQSMRSLQTGEAIVMMRNADTFVVQFRPPPQASSRAKISKFRDLVLARLTKPQSPQAKPETKHEPDSNLDLEDWL